MKNALWFIFIWFWKLTPLFLFFYFLDWEYALFITNLLYSFNAYRNSKKCGYPSFKAILYPLFLNIIGAEYVTNEMNKMIKSQATKKGDNDEVKVRFQNINPSPVKSIDDLDLDPEKRKRLEESMVVVGDDGVLPGITNNDLLDVMNNEEIKINWIYGITTAFDFSENREESFEINDKIYYYYEQKNKKHMLLKTVKGFEEGKKYIDEIISLNGGVDNFKKAEDYDLDEESLGSIEIKYIHHGDLFWIELQFINSIGKIEVAISKVDEFTVIDRGQNISGGISRHDKKIRDLIKGLDKIIYNESEGPSDGRLCVRGEDKDESFFIYAYFDTLEDSFNLFKKIIKNYDEGLIQELNSYEKNNTLDGIVRSTGIEYKSGEFELLLIRENVKYKFYLNPPGGFFNGKWK